MVVGRVRVDVITYEIVPRSNWRNLPSVLPSVKGALEERTYVYAAGKAIRRKLQFKLELINAFLEAAIATENQLILK